MKDGKLPTSIDAIARCFSRERSEDGDAIYVFSCFGHVCLNESSRVTKVDSRLFLVFVLSKFDVMDILSPYMILDYARDTDRFQLRLIAETTK